MFDFSITETLDELDGMSIKEKLQELDELHNELDGAASEVLSAKEELESEYKEGVEKQLLQTTSQFVTENNLENVLLIQEGLLGDKTYELIYDGHSYSLYPIESDGDWWWHIRLKEQIVKNQVRYDLLAKIATLCNLPYKNGNDDIEVRVEESELFEKIKATAFATARHSK